MKIDWDLFFKIVLPIATLLLGKYLDKIFKPKSRLITYYGHVSAFKLRGSNNQDVFTHSVVIINSGSETATNVRAGHQNLPVDFVVHPNRPYQQIPTHTGGDEIVFDKLVPKDQITISYLYFPPTTYNQLNSYIQSDEGLAKAIHVIPSPQPNKMVIRSAQFLMLFGAVSLIYLLVNTFIL